MAASKESEAMSGEAALSGVSVMAPALAPSPPCGQVRSRCRPLRCDRFGRLTVCGSCGGIGVGSGRALNRRPLPDIHLRAITLPLFAIAAPRIPSHGAPHKKREIG